jgi:uncharacterized protein (DUF58 family)
LTDRGRLTLLFGLAVYVVAWIFGSQPLYPVAVGLALAPLLGWAWVRTSAQPMHVRRLLPGRDVLEGEDVRIALEVDRATPVPPPSLVALERLGRLGEREVLLPSRRGLLSGRYELDAVPRGRYAFGPVRLTIEDPFGLYRTVLELGEPGALLVYPRLVELERVFSEGGAHAHEGRRLLLRRPSGFELHSVREYEQGESLRKVHWRSTARRGQLMVKELEDAPRDEIAVLLDGDASAVVGESFDVQVRAAGSILRAHVRRGRRTVLVVNSLLREVQAVHSDAEEWRRALELLAAVEPTARTPVETLVGGEGTPAGRALELIVVTARLTPALADRLVQRWLSRRAVSVVYVDPSSFAGAPRRAEPALLRLQSVGIAVAVLRRGDDLAPVLSGSAPEALTGA